eukprot:m.63387 g.63387  ORF g.63387 m.63387 type:complete len:104 (-) comp49638_c0_seq3:623-934(-)
MTDPQTTAVGRLCDAVLRNNFAECQRIVQKRGKKIITLQDRTGGTALHWACEGNYLPILQWFLQLRIDCNAPSSVKASRSPDDSCPSFLRTCVRGVCRCKRRR